MADVRPLAPVLELTRARLLEYVREPEALFWMFVFPVLMAIALGLAFPSRTEDRVVAGVVAGPAADGVAATLRRLPGTEVHVVSAPDGETALRRAEIHLLVTPGAPPTYSYDPARPESRLARRVVDDALQRAAGRTDPWVPVEQTRPTIGGRYVDWLVPGLLGMGVMSTGLWGVGFSIVQARTRKLLKRFIATPMRRRDYLLAQALARLVFLTLEAGVLLAFARLVLRVPMVGSAVLLALVCVVGALAFAGIGLLVASRTKTVEALSGLLNLVILPMWIVSGVFFASSNFPNALQPVIQALPLTGLNDALRAVMLEGAGLSDIWHELGLLTLWGGTTFVAALRLFRWN